MDLTIETVALLAAAAFLGSATQSALGLGGSTVFAPAAFIALPPARAIAAVTIYSLIINILISLEGRSVTLRELCRLPGRDDHKAGRQKRVPKAERKRVIAITLVASIPVQLVLLYWARYLPEQALALAGAAALALAAFSQIPKIVIPEKPRRARTLTLAAISALAGATKATVGANGPIIAPYIYWLGWPRWQMREALAIFFGVSGVINLVLLIIFHHAADHLGLIAVILGLTIPIFFGQLVGARFMRVLGREGHRWAVFGISLGASLTVALTVI